MVRPVPIDGRPPAVGCTVKKDIVVIGTSAGGMEALIKLAGHLPASLGATVFVVCHLPPGLDSALPRFLDKAGPLRAAYAVDGKPFEPGRIYVAPADRHLLVEEGLMRVVHGPKENRFRPAVDPLFRSAAYVYGPRVVGVVLTGAMGDGTAGLWTIKLRGGTTVVQDPKEAHHASMPLSAIQNVKVDHVAPIAEIAALLSRLSREEVQPGKEPDVSEQKKTQLEIRAAAAEPGMKWQAILELGEQTAFTCPECHGVLTRIREGAIERYRCHTGHAFSPESLLASVTEQIELRLWDSLRALDEAAMLLDHVGDHVAAGGDAPAAETYYLEAKRARERCVLLRKLAGEPHPVEAP
jgi:two-component system chemotaxis response regulator CheB